MSVFKLISNLFPMRLFLFKSPNDQNMIYKRIYPQIGVTAKA